MSRFATHTPEELQSLQRKQNAKNTDRATKVGIALLNNYLTAIGVNTKIEEMSPEELNAILIRFYAAARTVKGEYYKLNSMRSFRASIQRFYLDKCGVDILCDNRFDTSNICFNNVSKEIIKAGKGGYRTSFRNRTRRPSEAVQQHAAKRPIWLA